MIRISVAFAAILSLSACGYPQVRHIECPKWQNGEYVERPGGCEENGKGFSGRLSEALSGSLSGSGGFGTPDTLESPEAPQRASPGVSEGPTSGHPVGQNPGNDKNVGKSPYDGVRGEVPSGKRKGSRTARKGPKH